MEKIFKDRFDDINEMNKACTSPTLLDSHAPAKKLGYPDCTEANPLGIQKVKLTLPYEREAIIEYFTKLGEHLADSQDGIYIDMKTDYLGIDSLQITFPRLG